MATLNLAQNPIGKPAPTTISLAKNPVGKPVLGNRPVLSVAQNPVGKQLPPPAPAAVPAPTPAVQTNAAAAAPVSPLDSTYFQNLASNQLKVGGQVNALNQSAANDQTALQTALAALAYQQPRDQLTLEQGANQRGALYSSVYDQDLGNLNNTYQTKQSGDVQSNAQKQASIASSIAGDQQAGSLYDTDQYDAAVARAAAAAAKNPATGQTPIAAPAPAAGSALATAIAAAAKRPTISIAKNPIGKPVPKGKK